MAITLAWPELLVNTVAPDKVALAPVAGAENATATLGSGLFEASLTDTNSADANCAPTTALCPPPDNTVIEAGTEAVTDRPSVTLAVIGVALESATVMFTCEEPTEVGVPEITPAALIERLAGSPVADQV